MPIRPTRPLALQLVVAGTLLHAATAQAQPSQGSDAPRTWLQLQGVAAHWQMQTRGDSFDFFGSGGAVQGTPINTEDELGLPRRKPVVGLVVGRRIGQHWRIEVEHTQSQRQGSAVLGRELHVDGMAYAAGSTLESKVGLTTLGVLGGWSTTVGEATEAGVLLGGQWVRVTRRLHTRGTPASLGSEGLETATEPVLGLFVQHPLAPQWRLDGRITASPAGNYQATLGVQWLLQRKLSLGAGYRVTRHKLDVESFVILGFPSNMVVDAKVHGPMFSATLAF